MLIDRKKKIIQIRRLMPPVRGMVAVAEWRRGDAGGV